MSEKEQLPKDKAKEIVDSFKIFMGTDKKGEECYLDTLTAKQLSIISINHYIKDCQQSLGLSKEMHPHAQGLIAGTLVCWTEVKKEVENYEID